MKAGTDVERSIAQWLAEESPGRAPDRILTNAATTIDRTKQRRFAVAWREPVTLSMRGLVAFAAVIVIVVAGAAWLGRSTAAVGGPVPTTSPAPASAPPTALFVCGSRTLTWDGTSAIDLTGTWAGDDDGVYYIRQIGDEVRWLGMSGIGRPLGLRGADWTNVYVGTLSGDTITGTYADVPLGKIVDNGPVVLKLTRTSAGGIWLVRTDPLLSTGFGGLFMNPCTLG